MSEEKRAPLLSDEDMYSIVGVTDVGEWSVRPLKSPFDIRDFYEAKISEGELMVAKAAGVELVPNDYDCMLTCTGCRDGAPYYLLEEFDEMNFCPNCGAKIIKP